ncbi:hypothetical protein ACS127_15275 [Amphibacillus sp. Q70]|uniref:hypothetical protein n=1 Tax=Amphibacillus sp. Q70 TaxID=3453416 RepID=UPI003F8703D0
MDDILIPLVTFIIMIGGAVLKSFGDKGNKETVKRKPVTRQTVKPQPKQSALGRFEMAGDQVEDQQTEQLDQLRKDLNVSTQAAYDHLEKKAKQTAEDLDKLLVSRRKSHAMRKEELGIKKYLNRKGLAGTVVMSEVLGQPRAKKPYRINNR